MKDGGSFKTLPIYFGLLRFRDYSSIDFNGKVYIVGEKKNFFERGTMPKKVNPDFLSSEWFKDTSTRFDDVSFTQDLLRWYDKFLNSSGVRKTFDAVAISNILDFCFEFGMPIVEMPKRNPDGQFEQLPKILTNNAYFDAEIFFRRMQSVFILYDILCVAQSTRCYDHFLAAQLTAYANCCVTVTAMLSEKTKRIVQCLIASSLVDIAKHQLIYLFCEGFSLKKCENPSCCIPIINSRANMKYCSDACKQAHYRIRKKEKQNKEGEKT